MDIDRIRGLKALVVDAVTGAVTAVEQIHRETARRPFDVVQALSPEAVRGLQQAHDSVIAGTYQTIRLVATAVGSTLDAVIDTIKPGSAVAGDKGPPAPPPAM